MKIKYADYPNWDKVDEKEYRNKYFENEDFKGNVSILIAKKVKEKLYVTKNGKRYVYIDDGYVWLQFYPEDYKNIALTVALTNENKIKKWYFDIAKNSYLTEKGVPCIEDLYLDVELTPDGRIELLDEDELKEALNIGDITEDDYNLAYEYANKLIKYLDGKVEYLTDFTYKYLNLLK